MDAVLAKHPSVCDLVSNGWVFLHALSDDGRTITRRRAPVQWEAC